MSGYTDIVLLQYEIEKLHAELAASAANVAEFQSCIITIGNAATGYTWRGALAEYVADAFKQLAALKAENESLRKDAERYQWLKSQEPSKHDGYAIGYFDACGVDDWRMTTKDFDQAIDAAMA